ncbi:MAG: hypothetical protein ACLFVU_13165 [Phycisphaerae bacterium]
MRPTIWIILAGLLTAALCPAGEDTTTQETQKHKAFVAVLDFHCSDSVQAGQALADTIRLKLRRKKAYWVLDRLSTQEATAALPKSTEPETLHKLMKTKLGVNVAVYGSLVEDKGTWKADLVIVDTSAGEKPALTPLKLTDDTERWRAVIGKAVVETITGEYQWAPPEYGHEAEPKKFGKPLNENGSFDAGAKGWDRPDNVSTFIENGPKGRGRILRIRTDLKREPWLKYRRDLLMGKADPKNPPKIAGDTSYASVAGLEGVHFASGFLKATPGRRYWLTADHKGLGGAKVFVKGFRKSQAGRDSLPESALAEMGLTPEEFADLPPAKRKELIEKDAERHPLRYMRECYRWYLNCKDAKGEWAHLAAPFPPRGGLPKFVDYLQIQIYSYWPPGEYLWDNVHVYPDPRQKTPLPEVKPRTKNVSEPKSQEPQRAQRAQSLPKGLAVAC